MVFDIVVLAIALITIIVAVKRGGAKTIISVLSSFVSYFLSSFLGNFVANWIYINAIEVSIKKNISETLSSIDLSNATSAADKVINNLPAFVKTMLNLSGTDISGALSSTISSATDSITNDINKVIKPVLVGFIGLLLTLLFFVLISFVLRKTLVKLLIKIFKLPGLRVVNTVLGLIFGIVQAFLIISFIACLCKMVLPYIENLPAILSQSAINKSVAFKYFYNNNIFANLVNSIIKV